MPHSSNDELKLAEAEIESANARLNEIAAEYKPSIGVYARLRRGGRSDTGFTDAAEDLQRSDASIGIVMTWNLFDGRRTDYRASQAAAMLENSKLKMQQRRQELQYQALDKQIHEQEMRNQLALAKDKIELAKKQLKIAKKKYDMNLISTMQLRSEKLALNEAEDMQRTRQIDLVLAQVAARLTELK